MNGKGSPHIEDVRSVETMMLPQYYKENRPAGQARLENYPPQLCYLSSIYLLYLKNVITYLLLGS
jgi:hypothetical protein